VVTGGISTRWGGHTRVVVSEHSNDVEVVHAGAVLHLTVTTYRPVAPFGSGAVVGLVSGTLDSDTSVAWQVISTAAIGPPSLWWKLFSA
jgi:hypothetical protein